MYKLCVIRYESLSYHYDIQFVSKFLTFSQLAVKKWNSELIGLLNGHEISDKFHFSAVRFLKGTKLTMVLVFLHRNVF